MTFIEENKHILDYPCFSDIKKTKVGGIAQLVSRPPLKLGTWVGIQVGGPGLESQLGFDLGHPMHE